MTLQQHFAVAREIWQVCGGLRRMLLLTGGVEGLLGPETKALAHVSRLRRKLERQFDVDFPGQFNPYEDIEC